MHAELALIDTPEPTSVYDGADGLTPEVGKNLEGMLLSVNTTGSDLRVNQIINDAYNKILKTPITEVRFEPALCLRSKIGNDGRTQVSFPLPSGKNIGNVLRIGLPTPCFSPLLHSIESDTESHGLWVKISATSQKGKVTTVRVLLSSDENITGKESILKKQIYKESTPTELAINNAYQKAIENGVFKFPDGGLDISEKIATDGDTQTSFPLPSGKNIGNVLRIGLPEPCFSPKLQSIQLDEKKNGLWVEISGTSQKGKVTTVRVLLSSDENITGKESILKKQIYKESTPTELAINNAYQKAIENWVFKFPDGGLDISEKIATNGQTQTTFPLPSGKNIGENLGIGLPTPCFSPLLHSIESDTESHGLWVEISGTSKQGKVITVRVLLSSDKNITGKKSILEKQIYKESTPTEQAINNAYQKAIENGVFKFPDGGLDISEKISTYGMTQTTFPLPSGKNIGENLGIGLSEPCFSPLLHSIESDTESHGLWVEISGTSKQGKVITVRVLLSSDKNITGKKSILEKQIYRESTPTEQAINDAYQKAIQDGFFKFPAGGLDLSEKIATNGQTQKAFPLPCGKNIGDYLGIGLPQPCFSPKLQSIQLDEKKNGLWVEISGTSKQGKVTTVRVLLSSDENITGKESILEKQIYKESTLTGQAITHAYRRAIEDGFFKFPDGGLDISGKITTDGKAQMSFPLPSGKNIGVQLGIGLPTPCFSPLLQSIIYNKNQDTYLLKIEATNKHGVAGQFEVLISADGKILDKRRDDCTPLPTSFVKRIRDGEQTRARFRTVASSKQEGLKLLDGVKGECFEQIVGFLLAARFADQKVIPQYCLEVDEFNGYYGNRVDYKVGNSFFEVKWGRATDDIVKTYQKHINVINDQEYTIICLVNNDALTKRGVAYTLFSEYIQDNHPLANELADVMAIIDSLIEKSKDSNESKESSISKLRLIQSFLYSSLHQVSTNDDTALFGHQRIEALRKSLVFLAKHHEDSDKLISGTTRWWSTLEAYWEFGGQLRRNYIPIASLVEEQPERYDLGYRYWDITIDEDGEQILGNTFTVKNNLDCYIPWALSFMTTSQGTSLDKYPNWLSVEGQQDEHGWYIQPTFKITYGSKSFLVSSHRNTASGLQVKDLDGLRAIASAHGVAISDGDFMALNTLLKESMTRFEQRSS